MTIFLEIVLPLLAFVLACGMAYYLIRKIAPLLGNADPDSVDCVLYIVIGITIFWATFFSSEESYKYINSTVLFWIKFTVGTAGAGSSYMKAYRSGRKKGQAKS